MNDLSFASVFASTLSIFAWVLLVFSRKTRSNPDTITILPAMLNMPFSSVPDVNNSSKIVGSIRLHVKITDQVEVRS